MAIGLARLFGVRLPLNFNSPYKAVSIIDFWRRWHMTLSRFLRDYLYLPLGGNRKGPIRRYLNLIIVMLLGGLWHGAGWTFVFWGGLHGFYLMINHGWQILARHLNLRTDHIAYRGFAWIVTFLAVVIAWVFFRAESMDAALNMLTAMCGLGGKSSISVSATNMARLSVALAVALLAPNTWELMRNWRPVTDAPELSVNSKFLKPAWRPTVMWALFASGLVSVSFVLVESPHEFLYFQF